MQVNEELYQRVRALPRRHEDRQLYFRWHELWWCLWNVLAYQHDGMETEAAAARRNAADCARLLREHSDALDGPDASDIRIAWAAEMARYTLFRELRYEHQVSDQRDGARWDGDPWNGGPDAPATGSGAGAENWRMPRGLPLRHNQPGDPSGETSRCPIG